MYGLRRILYKIFEPILCDYKTFYTTLEAINTAKLYNTEAINTAIYIVYLGYKCGIVYGYIRSPFYTTLEVINTANLYNIEAINTAIQKRKRNYDI